MPASGATFLDYFQFHATTRPDLGALHLPGYELSYGEVYRDLLRLIRAMRTAGWSRAPAPVALRLRDPYAQVLVPMACEVLGLDYGWPRSDQAPGFGGWLTERAEEAPAGQPAWVLADGVWAAALQGEPVRASERLSLPGGDADPVRWVVADGAAGPLWRISRTVAQQRLLWTMLDGQFSAGDLLRLWSSAADEFMQYWVRAGLSAGACLQLCDERDGAPDPARVAGAARWEVVRADVAGQPAGLWTEVAERALAAGCGAHVICTTAAQARAAWTPVLCARASEAVRVSLATEVCGMIAPRLGARGVALLAPQLRYALRQDGVHGDADRLWVSSPFVAAPAHEGDAAVEMRDTGLRVRRRGHRFMELL